MTVTYFDNITNIIKYLRSNIYCKEEFRTNFSKELTKSIFAINTEFIPDQFGGWIVNVTTNRTKGTEVGISTQESSLYVKMIADALLNTIRNIDHSDSYSSVAANLANVIISGPDSIVVKI